MTKSKPPQPDTSKVARYVDESAVECIYSDDLHYRAVLLSDSATITDSIDKARLLARERLLELGARLSLERYRSTST